MKLSITTLKEKIKLSDDFLSQYKSKQPKWGFNGLGYIVYLRTYARPKPDGTLESWWETVRRFTEGNFLIEAKRLHELGKLTDSRLQILKEEMKRFYHLAFNLIILPPGRGIWMSGTEYAERIGDAENNCFRAGTKVHTEEGVVNIESLVGRTVKVLSKDGIYRPATFRSFGKQRLMAVTLTNGDKIYATPNHEWFLVNKSDPDKLQKKRVYTKDLKQGDRLPLVKRIKPSIDETAIAHGFVFGDGWINNTLNRVEVKLFGNKKELSEIIGKHGRRHNVTYKGEEIPMFVDLPAHFKNVPKKVSVEYARGFIVGLLAADGSIRPEGGARIHNKDKVVLEKIKDLALYAGYECGRIYMDREVSPYNGEEAPCYCLNLKQTSLDPSDFIRSDQRSKFRPAKRQTKSVAVVKVEETDLVEEVYCAQEPETHSFVIEGNVLTGNCWFVTMKPQVYGDSKIGTGIQDPKPSFPAVFTFDQAMKGGGVGVNIQRKYIKHMPKVSQCVRLKFMVSQKHEDYEQLIKIPGVGTKGIDLRQNKPEPFVIPDSREGWAEALRLVIDNHFDGDQKEKTLVLDVSEIRPEGRPIKGFGGVASGPKPLVLMLQQVNQILNLAFERKLTPTEWGDIIQLIGTCVVAGNVRRTALILLGDKDDQEFIQSKNYQLNENKEASQWRWASNNSVVVSPQTDQKTFQDIAAHIYYNGEPGAVNLELSKHYGRIVDGFQKDIDGEVEGFNPCGEITLPNGSPCNLFEVNLAGIERLIQKGIEDSGLYEEAFYLAARYAYRVTFREYDWELTRRIVQKHRRIGVGITGVTDWALMIAGEVLKEDVIAEYLDTFYRYVKETNLAQARELEANPSIKVTTVKPSGTVSVLMGVSPGMHYEWSRYMCRTVRFAKNAPLVEPLRQAGYKVEPAIKGFKKDGSYEYDDTTVVVYFPAKAASADYTNFKSAKDVSLKEQAALQAILAKYWSDNAVSATLTFHKPEEKPVFFEDGTMWQDRFGKPLLLVNPKEEQAVIQEIAEVLYQYRDTLKSTSLLPHQKETYPQMPKQEITEEEYQDMVSKITAKPWELLEDSVKVDFESDEDVVGECAGGACPIK